MNVRDATQELRGKVNSTPSESDAVMQQPGTTRPKRVLEAGQTDKESPMYACIHCHRWVPVSEAISYHAGFSAQDGRPVTLHLHRSCASTIVTRISDAVALHDLTLLKLEAHQRQLHGEGEAS